MRYDDNRCNKYIDPKRLELAWSPQAAFHASFR